MKDFESLINDIHKEKIREERICKNFKDNSGENIYINFCCWCNGQENASRLNEKDFKRFLQEEQIKLTQIQKIYLAKKYFNFTIVYDPINEKWKIVKNISN